MKTSNLTVLMKFVWQDISMLSAVQETFCGIHGPQTDVSNSVVVDIFENISYSSYATNSKRSQQ
jgi:hypothetical protein